MKRSNQAIEIPVSITAEAAWEIIGAVSGVDKWLGPITSCRVEGNQRFCGTEEGEFKEDILAVDNENMLFEYSIPQQHMLPIENIHGKMQVVENNNQVAIKWSWDFDTTDENEQVAKETLAQIGAMGIQGIQDLVNQTAAA